MNDIAISWAAASNSASGNCGRNTSAKGVSFMRWSYSSILSCRQGFCCGPDWICGTVGCFGCCPREGVCGSMGDGCLGTVLFHGAEITGEPPGDPLGRPIPGRAGDAGSHEGGRGWSWQYSPGPADAMPASITPGNAIDATKAAAARRRLISRPTSPGNFGSLLPNRREFAHETPSSIKGRSAGRHQPFPVSCGHRSR